jgi:WD40 repeat protein
MTQKLVLERTLGERGRRSVVGEGWFAISPSGKYVAVGTLVTVGGDIRGQIIEKLMLLFETATEKRVNIPTILPLTFLDDDTLLQTRSHGTIAISLLTGKEKLFSRGVTRIGNQIWEGKTKLLSADLKVIPFAGSTPASVLGDWFASSPAGDFVASSDGDSISIWKTGEYDTPAKSFPTNVMQSPKKNKKKRFLLGPGGSSALVISPPRQVWNQNQLKGVELPVTHLPDLDPLKGNKPLFETDAENQVVAISASGKRIITHATRNEGSYEIRDLTKMGTAIFEVEAAKIPSYRESAVSEQGDLIAIDRRTEKLRDGMTLDDSEIPYEIRACPDRVLADITLRGNIDWCKFSPNGELFAACDSLKSTMWAIPSGDEVKFPQGEFVAMAFTNDGSRVATVSRGNGLVRVWDIKSGATVRVFSPRWGSSLTFTPDDGKLLVGVGENNEIATEIMVCHLESPVLKMESPGSEFESPSSQFENRFESLASELTLKTNVQFFDLAATKEHILLATSTGIHVIGDPSKSPFDDIASSKTERGAAGAGP